MKLKWLEIERFRMVKPGTRLVFDDGINVVLGKNGTGKTTLLNLISALVTGEIGAYRQENLALELELEVNSANDGSSVELLMQISLISNTPSRIRGSESEDETVSDGWAFTVVLTKPSLSERVRIAANPEKAVIQTDERSYSTRVKNPFEEGMYPAIRAMMGSMLWKGDKRLLWVAPLQRLQFSPRFDEALQLFNRLFGDASGLVYWSEVARDDGARLAAQQFLLPEKDMIGARRSHDTIEMSSGHGVTWLDEAARLLDVDQITMYLRRTSAISYPEERLIDFGRIEFDVTFSQGTFKHHVLSHGQKRLLTFLFYLHVTSGPVIADELVNGMHHEWVEKCVEMLYINEHQAFLSSQNPLLLDELEFDSVDAAQRTFIVAEIRSGAFHWRQLTQNEARRFFTAYQTGIQHVGEVLVTEGLW